MEPRSIRYNTVRAYCANYIIAGLMSSNILGYSTAFTLQGTYPPIYAASFDGRFNVVQVLLDHGADMNHHTDVSSNGQYTIHTVIPRFRLSIPSNFTNTVIPIMHKTGV